MYNVLYNLLTGNLFYLILILFNIFHDKYIGIHSGFEGTLEPYIVISENCI